MKEIWKDIPDYNGYQISNLGNIKNDYIWTGSMYIYKPHTLKPHIDRKGYATIHLKNKTYKIHRLVALIFIPNPDNLPQVNHIDGNKQNNKVENLEWCSCKQNITHAIINNLINNRYDKNYRSSKVMQYDKYFNLINCYNSIIEAVEKTNVASSSISQCCSLKRKTAGGYIWRYADK